MADELNNLKVAILVTDGFEQAELTGPREALDEAGAKTFIVSPKAGEVQGWKHYEHADKFPVEFLLDEANAEDFDAASFAGRRGEPRPASNEPKGGRVCSRIF